MEEDAIGKWITPADRHKADYGQNVWATEVAKMAVTMGDTTGFLINSVVERIPDLLKDHLQCRYDTWDEFKRDVRSVPPTESNVVKSSWKKTGQGTMNLPM